MESPSLALLSNKLHLAIGRLKAARLRHPKAPYVDKEWVEALHEYESIYREWLQHMREYLDINKATVNSVERMNTITGSFDQKVRNRTLPYKLKISLFITVS